MCLAQILLWLLEECKSKMQVPTQYLLSSLMMSTSVHFLLFPPHTCIDYLIISCPTFVKHLVFTPTSNKQS